MGVAFSANLLTMFIFYEVLTLCTFPLVGHKETPEAMGGARRYLVYLLGTSLFFLLFAVVASYSVSGTLEFRPEGIMRGSGSPLLLTGIFVLFLAGITKAAMMPLHSWLPVKVVLHVFGVGLLSELGLGSALAYYASITIIVASVVALKQDNLKARLAYSTISQLSYVILGVALLTPAGVTGSVMHIVLHAFGKITLFFTAGAIYVATHKTRVSELNGIGRRMPFTMAAFTVGAISMIGVPPFGGFLSKWYLSLGAVEAGELPILLVLAGSTILNACYFLPIVYRAFFREPEEDGHAPSSGGIREAPALMVVPLLLTAAGAVALFFRPSVFLELARLVVAGVTGGS
jgi:multicomponent Na+:H+ antiporter subunit D